LRWLRSFAIVVVGTLLAAPAWSQRYVIIDQDLSSPADMAVMLLLTAPDVHLLGITVVSGNTWLTPEVAHGLRLVEGLGRTDVPVVAGAAFPLLRTAEETRIVNQLYGKPFFLGPYAAPDAPAGWDKINLADMPEGLPKIHAADETAAQFMVRMVHLHPHQVTIVAAGPLTNVALACRLDPHFAETAQELVLMGGSLNPQTTAAEWVNRPRHEFNFWFDPEASSITLREKWAKVTTTTIDVSLKTRIEPEVLDGLAKAHSTAAKWVTQYTTRPVFPNYLWDEMAVAAWLDPSLIKSDRVVYMDVATEHGPAYGDTLIYTDADKPVLVPSTVRAILDVDLPRLQTMIIDRLSK
jgi:purine nucleosidase